MSARPAREIAAAVRTSSAPSARAVVTGRRPDGDRPATSKARPPATCPATTAIVNSATPVTEAAIDCDSTKKAPPSPPRTCHGRSPPERTAPTTAAALARAFRDNGRHAASTASPEPKDQAAAA